MEYTLKDSSGEMICPKICPGKPNRAALELIMKDHGIDESMKSQILMIGDNPQTDIAFANNSGIDSCLVLTGNVQNEA